MRTKLLTIFSVAVLFTCALYSSVNCYDDQIASNLIQNFFSCNNKLVSNKASNDSKSNHQRLQQTDLENSFFTDLGLEKMSFDQGMGLIRKIYTDTNNCESDFCNCVYIPGDKYNIFFKNDINFEGLKSILKGFNEKYYKKEHLKNLINAAKFVKNGEKYPTLVEFLMKFDYTRNKLNFFNRLPNCNPNSVDHTVYFSY